MKNHWLSTAAVLSLFFLLALIGHWGTPNILDQDSFYYLGLGAQHWEIGFFNTDFPWTQFAVLKYLGSSLWYGFGVLMSPFAWIKEVGPAIKTAGVLLTFGALSAIYLSLKKLKLKMPLLWPMLMFFSAPNVMSRLLMVRPQIVSVGLSAVLITGLTLNNFWLMFLPAFGISWAHMNFFWMPVFMLMVHLAMKLIGERKIDWRSLFSVGGGVILGILLRPHPINALKLFYIQLVEQSLTKIKGLPILFGEENSPIVSNILVKNFGIFLAIWAIFLIYGWWQIWSDRRNRLNAARRPTAGGGLGQNSRSLNYLIILNSILSIAFFLVSILLARRAYDFWVLFGIFVIAAVFTALSGKIGRSFETRKVYAGSLLAIALLILIPYSSSKLARALTNEAYPPDLSKASGQWLAANAQPGELVFNVSWSRFSPLFYWARNVYYVTSLDPIFQYKFDEKIFWKNQYLTEDLVTKKTCARPACEAEELEDTYTFLKKELGSEYTFVEKHRNPAVYFYFNTDIRYEKILETKTEALFRIK